MRHAARLFVGAVVAGALVIGADARQTRTRILYASADTKGVPVNDLQPAELEIKVGGKTTPIVSVRPAQAPLRIALLVSDQGNGGFQGGIAAFLQKLLGKAEFAFTSVIVQPEKVLDYASDAGTLNTGLRRLGPRGKQSGAQLMEAILDTAKSVREPKENPSEEKRPVIVVMRVGGEAPTPITSDQVREELRKSRAILYVFSTVNADRRSTSAQGVGDAASQQQAQLRDDESTSAALHLGTVLGDGSKDSGGRHDSIVSTTLVPMFEKLADELLNQLEITFELPAGAKPTDKIAVSSKRKGVTVRAPARLPN
jgi:hypothetical protein